MSAVEPPEWDEAVEASVDLGRSPIGALLTRCRFPPLDGVDRHVSCAVSAGADSTALAALAVAAGFDVTVIHVDHGLRTGSAGEADLVAKLARRLGCRFRPERVTVEPGPNLEARARQARYAALPYGVLTGHTLDDQAETVLLNLMRGAALDGLAGMNPAAPHPRRPLLLLRRSETVALCQALELGFLTDPSNVDPTHRRNRVRHELLPLLDDIAGRDVAAVIARQAGLLRDDAAMIDAVAADVDPTDARALATAPLPVARRALRRWLTSASPSGHPPDAATVERCLRTARGEVTACEIGEGLTLRRSHQRLSIV